ncbi:MAG: hypothetical protein KDC38_16995, partial [Planctomycetes bacterium]|nr:hypothetical protein [Planctomycetota bacterium]
PFSVIALGADRITANLRWQLLRNFASEPDTSLAPRTESDLSSIVDPDRVDASGTASESDEAPSTLAEDLEPWNLFEHWAHTLCLVAARRPSDGDILLRTYLARVVGELRIDDPTRLFRSLLTVVDALPAHTALDWLARAVREIVPPHRFLALLEDLGERWDGPPAIAADDRDDRRGPIEDERVAPGWIEALLAPRDVFAMDLALQGVLRADRSSERRWLTAFGDATRGAAAAPWIAANSRRFFAGNGLRALFELSPEAIARELNANFGEHTQRFSEALHAMTEFSRLETSIVVGHLLETECAPIEHVLEFLGERPFPEMVIHVERLLEAINETGEREELGPLAIRALVTMNDVPSRELLARIRKERGIWGHRWRKSLRQAITDNLEANR